jgi:hypothetical protein
VAPGPDSSTFLKMSASFEFFKPSDEIYELLAVVPTNTVPDYSKPINDAYVDWFRTLVEETQPIALL